MQKLRILHLDSEVVVFEKPGGVLVHPPENPEYRKHTSGVDALRMLREQTGDLVYPVHRLDRATQGVMVMARNSEAAARLQRQFSGRSVSKVYLLLCRGWLADQGCFDAPLALEHDPAKTSEAVTEFQTLQRFELPVANGKHSTSRFSLMRAEPKTGRFHQIRRHFKSASHPLIGDTVHGDGRQNRIWREITGASKLYLMSWQLAFDHPGTGERVRFRARFSGHWHPVFDRAGVCPVSGDL